MGVGDATDLQGVTITPDAPTGPSAPSGIVDERLRSKLTPYLGPDPVPSRQLATSFQILSGIGAALWVARAVLFYVQSNREPNVVVDGFAGTVRIEGANAAALGVTGLIGFALVVALIAVDLLWRRQRRPKDVLQAYGEAYVELPMIWVFPMRYRLLSGAGVGLALLAGANSSLNDGAMFTDLADIQDAYRWSAVSAIGWAVLWATGVALPWLADRSHQRRLEWSAWYRDRPGTVGFVTPVRDNDIGDPAGAGWILRTAGLVLLALTGIILVFAGLEASGEGDTGAALICLLLAALSLGIVIRAFVRRRTPRNIRNGF
jgi:hypothetical protein